MATTEAPSSTTEVPRNPRCAPNREKQKVRDLLAVFLTNPFKPTNKADLLAALVDYELIRRFHFL